MCTPTSRCGSPSVALHAVAICAVLSGCQVEAPAASTPQARIDAIIQGSYPGSVGVELAIFKDGRLLFERGYGLRDRGLPDAFAAGGEFWGLEQPDQTFNLARGVFGPDADTLFNLASVSKEFTAGAVLLLQQDGRLSTDDLLSKYFPAFPNGDSIPLLFLLQHRSGLVDYNQFGGQIDFSAAYRAFLSNGQVDYTPILEQLATYPLDFAPGSQFEYSNTNYLLLALIVQQVSGEPFGAFMRRRIFEPLSMTFTNQG
jgi:CubicO group peptidase (beta-lactamase class C family)